MRQQLLPLAEWQSIYVTLHKVQGTVVIGARVIPLRIDVPSCQAAVVARLESHGLLPGERRGHGQAGGETAVELHLQRVEGGGKALEVLGFPHAPSELNEVRLSSVAGA